MAWNGKKRLRKPKIGEKIVFLEYLGPSKKNSYGHLMGYFRCRCGNEIERTIKSVVRKDIKSCGCRKYKYKDRVKIGDKFGKLTLVDIVSPQKSNSRGLFICDCGSYKRINLSHVYTGTTKSCGCLHKSAGGLGWFNSFKNSYKLSAKKRNLLFELTDQDIENISFKDCFYCGKQSVFRKGLINGIDRIDNNLGYTIQNCVPCCAECNYAKGTMDDQDFIRLCQRVSKHFENKGELQCLSQMC